MRPAHVPYGGYWSTPFVKWQGALSSFHSLRLAAWVGRRALAARNIDPALIEEIVLGMTVPQQGAFYGAPWLASLIGMPAITGPTIAQACATSVRCLALSAGQIEREQARTVLVVAADRTSNGPTLLYPEPGGQGGQPVVERWILDNFAGDPNTALAMVTTAENVARSFGISTEEQHDLVLMRLEQYRAALADDSAFLKRFMALPFDLPDRRFSGIGDAVPGDVGVVASTRERLAGLSPVLEGGTVTFAAQTHPADGNAGMIVASRERAAELSAEPGIAIRIRAFGQARAKPAFMPEASALAAGDALRRARIEARQCDVIKSHNPFAVNDILFARLTGVDLAAMNNFGCSLIYGHPQAPTGLRGVIEVIEELVLRGGGVGLFHGCAAGDTGMAVVIEVGDDEPA